MNNVKYKLISHYLCPFVQRAVIALNEQNIPYERIDIDLNNKPDWFLKLSPLGKVPVLVVEEDVNEPIVLFESAVIAEYINETTHANLLSDNPLTRAKQRAWIEFASATIFSLGSVYSAGSHEEYLSAVNQLEGKWQQLEDILSDSRYFAGEDFSLVDAAFGPAFRYLSTFEHLTGENFLAEFPKVDAWKTALLERPTVISAVRENYPALLTEFIANRDSYLGSLAKNSVKVTATA